MLSTFRDILLFQTFLSLSLIYFFLAFLSRYLLIWLELKRRVGRQAVSSLTFQTQCWSKALLAFSPVFGVFKREISISRDIFSARFRWSRDQVLYSLFIWKLEIKILSQMLEVLENSRVILFKFLFLKQKTRFSFRKRDFAFSEYFKTGVSLRKWCSECLESEEESFEVFYFFCE